MLFVFFSGQKCKEKIKGVAKRFFINVPDKITDLVPMYLWMRWRTQGYVVMGRKYLFVG